MKKFILIIVCSAMLLVVSGQTAFKHIATSANISNNFTTIDNGASNSHPEKILIITPDYGTSGPYFTKPSGVWYRGDRWYIFTQDRSPMVANAKFNVLVASPGSNAFVYTASASTISGHVVTINHPSLNNRPGVRMLVTQNWGSSGPYNNHPLGVYYALGKWRIYNQDKAPIPANAKFNIYIDNRTFEIQASSPNGHWFKFSNSSTNNNPDALVFATQYWTSIYNPNETGVWYNVDKWSVFNQNRRALPRNARFNILAIGGSPSTALSIPAKLWQAALNSLLSSMNVRINNFTSRDFEFTRDNTYRWYKPNDCNFRIGTGAFVLDTTFNLNPFRLNPMTIYINDFNKLNAQVSHEAGKIKVRVNFEQSGTEVRTNCIDNLGCGGIGNPNFNFINPAIEILIRPVITSGQLSYDNAEVRLFGSLDHEGFNLTVGVIQGIINLLNFDVNNELRTKGSEFMSRLLNDREVKRKITEGLNAHPGRAASFGFSLPDNIRSIRIDGAGNMIITRG